MIYCRDCKWFPGLGNRCPLIGIQVTFSYDGCSRGELETKICKSCRWFKGNGKPCVKSGGEPTYEHDSCSGWKNKTEKPKKEKSK